LYDFYAYERRNISLKNLFLSISSNHPLYFLILKLCHLKDIHGYEMQVHGSIVHEIIEILIHYASSILYRMLCLKLIKNIKLWLSPAKISIYTKLCATQNSTRLMIKWQMKEWEMLLIDLPMNACYKQVSHEY